MRRGESARAPSRLLSSVALMFLGVFGQAANGGSALDSSSVPSHSQDDGNSRKIRMVSSDLGTVDPPALIDPARPEDLALIEDRPLAGLARFPDALRRAELAEFLRGSGAPAPTVRAVWECAIASWSDFVATMEERQAPWRREVCVSAAELGAQWQRDGEPDPALMARHSAKLVRYQAERAGVEERFLVELAMCAELRLVGREAGAEASDGRAVVAGDADGKAGDDAPPHPLETPIALLAPLIERARVRNTECGVLHFKPRWSAIDPRGIFIASEPSCDALIRAEVVLSTFEAVRTTHVVARYRAEQQARGRSEGFAAYWRVAESRERAARSETRRVIDSLREILGTVHGERFMLASVGEAYPELAPELRLVLERLSSSPSDADASSAAVLWREELMATVRACVAELDALAEGHRFLARSEGEGAVSTAAERWKVRLAELAARAWSEQDAAPE